MTSYTDNLALARMVLGNPSVLRVRPDINLFLMRYLSKFRLQRVGPHLIVHSHLPPLTSEAYSRFVKEHLVAKIEGPSHAQIGIAAECPQRCGYCYNRDRQGEAMDTPTVMRLIDELKDMGVVWLGFTGGEPLMNRDLVKLTAHAADDCAVKLFTTGCGLTSGLAGELAAAGLFSIAVSLDHWDAAVHDAGRGVSGAHRAALDAIAAALTVPGLHVSVSAVTGRDMVLHGDVPRLLDFFQALGIHEAWFSEVKPSSSAYWSKEAVLTASESQALVGLQDAYNRRGGMTVNYLGHFEAKEHFGCNAGCKMIYIDPFGEVSPCVFVPLSFGNVRERPLADIVEDMRELFPGEDSCFVNKNWGLLAELGASGVPLGPQASREMLSSVRFGPMADFNRRLYRRRH